jgi:putative transposase
LFMTRSRSRTPSEYVGYGLYLYFSGLSLRRTAERISYFVKRNHVSIWNWIQKYNPRKISVRRRKISGYIIIDETLVQVGSESIWLWVAIDSKTKRILALNISKERNMLVAERFIASVVKVYGKHPVSTDDGTWYPQACRFLRLTHHLHSTFEKSIIERTIQYIKDRTESFDDYFPCRIKNCKLEHIKNWLQLFADYYNSELDIIK